MKFDFAALSSQLDLEGKYVEFSLLRNTLTVERVVRDLETELTEPNADGECRATCPKCRKARSFAVNINTNRFNCFNKGCFLKGSGVIDLIAKLREVPAKDASHLLACAYGIQPYSPAGGAGQAVEAEQTAVNEKPIKKSVPADRPDESREAVSRAEFEALREKVERLSLVVWSNLFESGEMAAEDQFFDDDYRPDEERETVFAR